MAEFALLGALGTGFLAQWPGPLWRKALDGIELAIPAALIDETIQLFSPGRGSLVTDVWVDIAGAAVGVFVITVLCWLWRRRKRD